MSKYKNPGSPEQNNSLRIANELAEANRLKRLEMHLDYFTKVMEHSSKSGRAVFLTEKDLEDQA